MRDKSRAHNPMQMLPSHSADAMIGKRKVEIGIMLDG